MVNEEVLLIRDCRATVIPAGDPVTLEEGTPVFVTQALGGTITVRAKGNLFRIAPEDLDALGEGAAEGLVPEEAPEPEGEFSEQRVWEALKNCYDPEIPINIVDLGLIYDLGVDKEESGQHFVRVKMTLTAQGCGMGPVIAEDARTKIAALPQVRDAAVEIVWEPVWTPQMISEEGRKKLGLN